MSYVPPNPSTVPPPRHQGHQGNRGARRDMNKQPFQHRAQTGAGLITPPPYAKLPGMPQHRVLIPQGNIFPNAASVPPNMMRAHSPAPGLYSQPPAAAAAVLPHSAFLQLQQPQQPAMMSYHAPTHNTQQPIALGQPMNQQQMMPHIQRMLQPNNPPVMYNTQDQQQHQPVSDISAGNSQKPAKRRSHAIKIVDPNTNTEVNLGGDGNASAETAAKFKNQVQQAVEGNTSLSALPSATTAATLSAPSLQSGGGAPPQQQQQQYRPNAIITTPVEDKKEGGAAGIKEEEELRSSLSEGALTKTVHPVVAADEVATKLSDGLSVVQESEKKAEQEVSKPAEVPSLSAPALSNGGSSNDSSNSSSSSSLEPNTTKETSPADRSPNMAAMVD